MTVFFIQGLKVVIPLSSGLMVSDGKSAADFIMGPLCVGIYFFLAAFKIFSLSLIFNNLTGIIRVCLAWSSLSFLVVCNCVLHQVSEACGYNFFKYFFFPLFSFPTGIPIMDVFVCKIEKKANKEFRKQII